jgi:hypothetical protein
VAAATIADLLARAAGRLGDLRGLLAVRVGITAITMSGTGRAGPVSFSDWETSSPRDMLPGPWFTQEELKESSWTVAAVPPATVRTRAVAMVPVRRRAGGRGALPPAPY